MRVEDLRYKLCDRLLARRSEIEQTALSRVHAIADDVEGVDPEYLAGLRSAVSTGIRYGIEAVTFSEDGMPPIPTPLLAQARLAARNDVKLDTVLRRYLAGYRVLGDFLIEEAEVCGVRDRDSMKGVMRVQTILLDRLVTAIGEEYEREARSRRHSGRDRRLERVERLLTGELLDTTDLAYDLDAHHLSVVASGPDAVATVAHLTRAMKSRNLTVRRGEETVWAWFAANDPADPGEVERELPDLPVGVSVALGEPGKGFAGWRLSHQQAKAALPIAQVSPSRVARYADVALVSSIRQDETLVASLQCLYLEPLTAAPDGGVVLRETLRAYFATGRNASSAAASLTVDRRTVTNRLRAVEECIDRQIDECAVDLQMALKLEWFGLLQ